MPSFNSNVGGADSNSDPLSAVRALSGAYQSHISNLNATPSFVGVNDGTYPSDAVPGSFTAEAVDGGINFGVVDGSRTVPQIFNFSQTITNFLGTIDHPGDPVVADFPSDGNYGWFRNDTSGAYGIVLNDAGSIVFPNFVYISGTISLAQHGNLGAGATEPHDFTQVSGVMTDAQHGTRSGGTLHAAATTSANGFATASQITQLNTATSNISTLQTTVTDITTGGTASNIINATKYEINGTTVLNARDTPWSVTGSFTSRKGLTTATSSYNTLADLQILADVVYTIVNSLISQGLFGP